MRSGREGGLRGGLDGVDTVFQPPQSIVPKHRLATARGFPLFRPFFLPLPVDHSREKGDPVGGGGAFPISFFRPLHRAAHGGGL